MSEDINEEIDDVEMGMEMTEENEDEVDLEQFEEQVEELHDALDEIKMSGQQIENHLMQNGDIQNSKRQQILARRAGLLYQRVENGDRSIVRGE